MTAFVGRRITLGHLDIYIQSAFLKKTKMVIEAHKHRATKTVGIRTDILG